MKAIVAERGQVTIPKSIRERLGIGPRTVLDIRAEKGRLVAVKHPADNPFESVRSCLKLDGDTDEWIAAMRDDRGLITLPGVYYDVIQLTALVRRALAELPLDVRAYAEQVGAEPAGGEKDLPLLERRWARPTLDVHGFVGGHQGAGAKTVIPARATAKISMRLVADQRPEQIIEGFRRFVSEHAPAGVRAEVEVLSRARPVLVDPDSPAVAAASAALREAFGAETALVRNGASVPITEIFQRILHVDPVLMGLGLPGDRLHSPNEHFQLEQFHRGALAAASLLQGLSGLG